MSYHNNPRILNTLKIYTHVASFASMGIGFLVLIGWFAEINFLKSIFLNAVTMKANAALCFLLFGVSFWLKQKETIPQIQKYLGQVIASLFQNDE